MQGRDLRHRLRVKHNKEIWRQWVDAAWLGREEQPRSKAEGLHSGSKTEEAVWGREPPARPQGLGGQKQNPLAI